MRLFVLKILRLFAASVRAVTRSGKNRKGADDYSSTIYPLF